MAGTINWTGQSGQTYKHWIYPIGTTFDPDGGNYVFAKEVSEGRWKPVYIGETGDLSDRFDNHHKAGEIRLYGATHIHVHTGGNKQNRLSEEADLIAKWNPPANG